MVCTFNTITLDAGPGVAPVQGQLGYGVKTCLNNKSQMTTQERSNLGFPALYFMKLKGLTQILCKEMVMQENYQEGLMEYLYKMKSSVRVKKGEVNKQCIILNTYETIRRSSSAQFQAVFSISTILWHTVWVM